VARLSVADAERLGVGDGDAVTVSSGAGTVTVPVLVTDQMVDGVVWLPTNSLGCAVRAELQVGAGGAVDVVPAPDAQERRVPVVASPSAYTSYANTAPVEWNAPPSGAGFDKGLPQ
jgi:NADH-quinone oxidoreductase subunit G